MAVATIELSWELSHSKDVVRQDITVMTQSEGQSVPVELLTDSVGPAQNTYTIKVPEKTTVFVRVIAFDGTYYSKPMVNQFTVHDLSIPCPPVNNGWKILDIEQDTPCY